MRTKFLPFSPPLIGDEEIAEVVDTLRSDWITTGPKVKRFEQEFVAFVGAQDALAVSSCTAALHLALLAFGIGPGDSVIVSPFTFCSAVHVIEHVGATPILVDVEPGTLNIDPAAIEQAIVRTQSQSGVRVKAIMPVHLYGHACELDQILAIAEKHRLAVIEDAAHSLPAKYKGCRIGSYRAGAAVPIATCFSFYATKNLTTAEGGMLTGAPEVIDRVRAWALHGMDRDAWKRYGAQGSWFYDVICPGYKYNMTDLQAALGLVQLRKLPDFHARRRQIARQYNAAFSGRREFQTPTERPEVEHAWHLYVLRLNTEHTELTRDRLIAELHSRNIGTSVHFIPVHLHKYYRQKYGFHPDHFPIASREYEKIISLPLSPAMSDADISDVIAATKEILHEHRKSIHAKFASV